MDVLFQIEDIETFTQVLEEVLDTLYDLDHILCNKMVDLSCIMAAKKEIKSIILDTNLNTNEASELLSSKHYNDNKLKTFISLLEKKKSELLNSTLVHYNCAFGDTLNTFDWKIKLVCGTSELKTFSYALLQLALYTVTRNHKPALRLHELNKDMLARLIGTLEKIVGDKMMNENDQ